MRIETNINIGDTVLWRGKERIVRSVKAIVKRNIDFERTEVIFYKVIGSKVWAREDELTYVHGFRTKPVTATIVERTWAANEEIGSVTLTLSESLSANPKDTTVTCDVPVNSDVWRQLEHQHVPSEVTVWLEWKTDDTDKHHRYRTITKIEMV